MGRERERAVAAALGMVQGGGTRNSEVIFFFPQTPGLPTGLRDQVYPPNCY